MKKNNIKEIISGIVNRADKLGVRYSKKHIILLKEFLAKWNLYSRRAGILRNIEMAQYLNKQDNVMAIVF